VERAAYYIVSEALTNTAKHARAATVHVVVEARDGVLGLSIRDDGVGGADPTRGSGLIGLTDRVDALAGTIDVASPVGAGTTLLITLPIETGQAGPAISIT
jgi:signal transduction histidine kinase